MNVIQFNLTIEKHPSIYYNCTRTHTVCTAQYLKPNKRNDDTVKWTKRIRLNRRAVKGFARACEAKKDEARE